MIAKVSRYHYVGFTSHGPSMVHFGGSSCSEVSRDMRAVQGTEQALSKIGGP